VIRRGFGRYSFGLQLESGARIDAQDSTYVNPNNQQTYTDRRQDLAINLEPHFIWRPLPRLELRVYGRRSWVMSTVNTQDYGFDFSHTDTVAGLVLRTFWSSY
jgi:hypothetical protein